MTAMTVTDITFMMMDADREASCKLHEKNLVYGVEWLTQPECAPHESSVYTNKVLLAAYVAEAALKMFAVRALYWTNGFKILDIVLVGISIVGQLCQTVPGMQFLRIVRVARIRKILHVMLHFPELHMMVHGFRVS